MKKLIFIIVSTTFSFAAFAIPMYSGRPHVNLVNALSIDHGVDSSSIISVAFAIPLLAISLLAVSQYLLKKDKKEPE
jgi:hypothetical protein